MQRSSDAIEIQRFKAFYAKPMEQMVTAFLQAKPEAYENLMRRVRHSNDDQSFLIEYIETHYALALGNPQELKQLSSAALTLLGLAYEMGWMGDVDYRKAKSFYKLAIKKRNATALFRLGWLHEKGLGVTKENYDKAKKYYELAQAGGNTSALVRLGKLYLSNKISVTFSREFQDRDVNYIMSFINLFKKYNAAADLHFTAASQRGNIEMIVMLTRGVKTLPEALKESCKKAAAAGIAGSLIQLGATLIAERGELKEGCAYFEAAADEGHIAGLEALCWVYEKHGMLQEDYDKVVNYAHKFLEAKDYNAAFYLGWLFGGSIKDVDFTPETNVRVAAHYYRLAAEAARFDIQVKARQHLRRLYESTNDPVVFYHQCLYPVPKYRYGVAKSLNRECFLELAQEQPEILDELTKMYKDTWGKVMLLFDPMVNITPSVQLAHTILSDSNKINIQLPRELVELIMNLLNTPHLKDVLFIKSMMFNELDIVVSICISIIARKWIQEGFDQQCDTTLRLQGKDHKTYVKKLPHTEKEKWQICTALRNGSTLFSVKEGLRRIEMIEQAHPGLYAPKGRSVND